MLNLRFDGDAWDEYNNAEKKDREKIFQIIKELRRGNISAHAEHLSENLSGKDSSRVNKKERLLYAIEGNTLIIYSCKYDYHKR